MRLVTERLTEPGEAAIDLTLCQSCSQWVTVCHSAPRYKHEGRVEIDQSRWFGYIARGHCMLVCPELAITVRGRGISSDIAAIYAVLAAESLGLGTSFTGLPGVYFKSDRKLRRKYNVPDGIQPGIMVIAGYPAVNWKRTFERRFARVHFA